MTYKLAVDFGTTNSVVACWNTEREAAEIVAIPAIGTPAAPDRPSLAPSLIYVHDAARGVVTIGQRVRDQKLDYQKDNRLFRNFKRGIVASPAPDARFIDGLAYTDRDAGRHFLTALLDTLPYPKSEIEQLVLTAPVASFEGYLVWLNSVFGAMPEEKIRIVDESTAAALGYAVTVPGAVVLVFDFGGGTLDLSLVQLPESREKTGGLLSRLLRRGAGQHYARVIAKAGRVIGGSDIDQWIVAEVLKRTGVSIKDLGVNYTTLVTNCELAKIALSSQETAEIRFESAGGTAYAVTLTRPELEAMLEDNGFSNAVRRIVDKVMHIAHQRGVFKEDVKTVLLVGGTSLMPAVQNILKGYFTGMTVRADKPFTAVAEGALQVAAGFGLDDYLAHSYGLRHLDNGLHRYDEIVPMGSRYPTPKPIEIVLGAAHEDQQAVEFVVGEIDSDAASMLEVRYEDGQAVFVAQAGEEEQKIVALNEEAPPLASLLPPGVAVEDRLKALFSVDDRRQLRLTVVDLHTQQELLHNVVVTTLR
ncbi:MAG TPA: Hsp70 family protein [Aggregatilineales bacterium]|nr:Hsp70 family protein [Aggregatilineales bacterium]